MQDLILYTDEVYRYVFVEHSLSKETLLYYIAIELSIEDADRKNIVNLEKAPISDMNFFRDLLLKNGVRNSNILKNLKISLSGLFSRCINLRDITVLKDFDYSNVIFYDSMFESCCSLDKDKCGFHILENETVRERMSDGSVLCVHGMFACAYNYAPAIPSMVGLFPYSIFCE